MNELSLFTGAGGGLLGTTLLGWKHCGYIEFNDYCQRVIAQRIKDGILDEAPIFSDIRTFISEGYADSYKGMVDVVTGGFPCQPFSVAGKQAGEDDERNMWPQTIEVVRRVKPAYCYFENVRGLLSASVGDESIKPIRYFGTVLRDLAECGFDVRWRILSAAETGAPHKRDRVWIVAHSDSNSESTGPQYGGERVFSDANCNGLQRRWENGKIERQTGLCDRERSDQKQEISPTVRSNWWTVEPRVGRVVNGVAHRVDRLKAIGNGQVPAVVRAAWELLNDL